MKRYQTGVIFGAAAYAIAWSAGASPVWAAVVGLVVGAFAAALT